MSFINSFERGMERFLVPIAHKLNTQRHISSIRDAFIYAFPLVLSGSIIVLINYALLSPDGFLAKILFLNYLFPNLADAKAVLAPVVQGTTNIISLLITFLVARNIALTFKQDELLCGLTSLAAFFIIYPSSASFEGNSYVLSKFFGAQGIFVSVIVGLVSSEIFCRLAANPKLLIKMPDQVPPAVARSFKILIPIMMVLVFFSVMNYVIKLVAPDGLHSLVYSLIQTPLKELATNIVSLNILIFLANVLWFFGIHGPNTLAVIIDTAFAEATIENLNFVAEHGSAWGAPHIVTWSGLYYGFGAYGGGGMTLGLLIAIFIASRREDYRSIAKLSIGPGIFNINEPVIFGLPIVLNPIMIIPFIFVPIINTTIGYIFTVTKLIPPIAYSIPWTTPGPLMPFLGTGGNWIALLVGILCLALSVLIYLPFVIVSNKASQLEQNMPTS